MLRDKDTKKQICVGDKVTMKGGEVAEITDITDLVYLKNDSGIPTEPYGVFMGVINAEYFEHYELGGVVIDERTHEVHEWMKSLPDDQKMIYAINWRIPNTLFNVSCKFRGSENLQGIDWGDIHNSKDLGFWGHGGTVYFQHFG